MNKLSLTIDFDNPQQYPVGQRQLHKIIAGYLSRKDYCGRIEITVRIVDRKTIKDLNRRFRCQNKITDVLSFPVSQPKPKEVSVAPVLLGEIVLCWPQIKKQSHQYCENINQELRTLVLHSLDHLLGKK